MSQPELTLDNLDPDPLRAFEQWLHAAQAAGLRQPLGMTLSTATPDGQPSARIVLLRGFDRRGFVFYTNYRSRKCREIEANPVAALTIWWPEMDRQVRIEGRLERTSAAESDAYWATRPRASQVSAVVSPQSELIRGKEELLAAAADLERRMAGGEIPRPSTWGGMRLIPDVMEFWQEGPHRLHDRIRYRRRNDQWIADRLAP